MIRVVMVGLPLAWGCTSSVSGPDKAPFDTSLPPPVDYCLPQEQPVMQLSQDGMTFAVLLDGQHIDYGLPPQGGAPYAPFVFRLGGLDITEPLWIDMRANRVSDGVDVGEIELAQGFICSNTGLHDGYLVGAEVHMRFPGYTLDELEGWEVDVYVEASDTSDRVASWVSRGHQLQWEL